MPCHRILLSSLAILSGGLLFLSRPVRAQTDSSRGVVIETSPEGRFHAGNKWAVLVGVNQYLDPAISNLKYCVSDVRLMEKTLTEQCGYESKRVLVIADDQEKDHLKPFRFNLDQQIRDWLKFARAGDTVVVFFSGHGFLDEQGQGFLAAKDCQRTNLGLTALRTDAMRDMLRQCKASQKLLILDCCHAGGTKGDDDAVSGEEMGAAFSDAEGLITLASCHKDEKSHELGSKQQGLFTYYLARGLGEGEADFDRNGVIDSAELYRYTAENVPLTARRELNAVQRPVQIRGEDVFGVFGLAHTPRSVRQAPDIKERARNARAPAMESGLLENRVQLLTNHISMEFRLIPSATFLMGSPETEQGRHDNEGPQHRVEITKPFYIGTTEVTQKQWEEVMGTRPWKDERNVSEGASYPASYVSFEQAQAFTRKLTEACPAGRKYRLPTEAEFELAFRAGSNDSFHFGENELAASEFSWWGASFGGNCEEEQHAHQVAKKKPNAFGLYDMAGNVSEWCQDFYAANYYRLSTVADPKGPVEGFFRVLRGGSWQDPRSNLRSSFRSSSHPQNAGATIGFRVAFTIE